MNNNSLCHDLGAIWWDRERFSTLTSLTYLSPLPTYLPFLPTFLTFLLPLPTYLSYLLTSLTYLPYLPYHLPNLPTLSTYLPYLATYLTYLPTLPTYLCVNLILQLKDTKQLLNSTGQNINTSMLPV